MSIYSPLICTSYLPMWNHNHGARTISFGRTPATTMRCSRSEYPKGVVVKFPSFRGLFCCYAPSSVSLHFSASCWCRLVGKARPRCTCSGTSVHCTCSSNINASSAFPAAGRWHAGRLSWTVLGSTMDGSVGVISAPTRRRGCRLRRCTRRCRRCLQRPR